MIKKETHSPELDELEAQIRQFEDHLDWRWAVIDFVVMMGMVALFGAAIVAMVTVLG